MIQYPEGVRSISPDFKEVVLNKPKALHLTRSVVIFFLLLLIISNFYSPTTVNAEEPDDNTRAIATLFPTFATVNTYRVTLTLSNLMGSTPPSAKWYDPDGDLINAGGSPVRDYEYVYGSLIETRDYFYISSRADSLKPGTYRVIVSGYADKTFYLKDPKTYTYLPMILTPLVPPGPFNKLSPADESDDTPIGVKLEWEQSKAAETYAYCFDTTDDGACSNWKDAGGATSVRLTGLEPFTTYYWQVRAVNSKGTVYADGSDDSFWSFTTGDGTVEIEDMVLIEAGSFMMGCDLDHNDDYDCQDREEPLHTVYLDGYYIDTYEVTNEQYLACVNDGACVFPADVSSNKHPDYFNNPTYFDYPMINVTWQEADDFCQWLGKRLPTEAEWEKAARGTSPQAYPWGDDPATCDLANYGINFSTADSCVGDTMPLGSYPDGVSPYGVFDMAGNVEEWVSDWYDPDYYKDRPVPDMNPLGPADGDSKVIRGGSWYGYDSSDIRTAARWGWGPEYYFFTLGFRCAMDAP